VSPEPYYADEQVTLLLGDTLDVLRTMPDASVDCCVTSPPYYGLRDYGVAGQYGLEPTVAEYVETMRAVFAEVRRVLADDGTLWLNIGDSYSGGSRSTYHADSQTKSVRSHGHAETRPVTGLPGKNLLGMPWRVAFALQDDGWILRSDIAWHKTNAMPESVTDRPAANYEHVFLLAKQPAYHFDLDAIRAPLNRPEALKSGLVFGGAKGAAGKLGGSGRRPGGNPSVHGHGGEVSNGRNPGSVWSIPTAPYPEAHFAVMAPELAKRCIKAGCKPGGTVLDPFSGSGTTGEAARMLGRRYVGIDLNPAYHDLAVKRFVQPVLDFADGAA